MLFKSKHGYLPGVIAAILSLIGLVFIYSASCYSADIHYGDPFFFVKKQAIALAVGAPFFFVGRFLPINLLKNGKWLILILSVGLLALVFVPGLGMSSYGATRWITLGFITFQPSEIAKFGLMIFLAGWLDDHPVVSVKNVVPPLLSVVAVCGLVISEPNMSVTMVIGLSVLVMLYVSGVPKKWFVLLLFIVLAGAVGMIIAEPYRMKRIVAFLDPWQNPKAEGYQLIQSYYAISSGGLFGVGLFRSRQKMLFLPFAESDFIFSVIAEETGLFGCMIVMALFCVFVFCGIKTALAAKTRYETFLSAGLTAVIGWQAIVNFAVVTGCVPPTGVPLPFVSAGGSSLISFLFVTGILSGLSARTKDERKA